ncbi:sensor histidine kinase [Amaricoccus solimangrovi]|uniref:histidine kinase n=1 Tax=Amaricoccus solimangrovi TaxID=2589815 RepID=A0A501WK61_9RHOB|nr:ATP-binding protein [Amaricoccus solimangrovi]TPE49899.1 sensor histidine kinase [Amaricoccus solimangrovi]
MDDPVPPAASAAPSRRKVRLALLLGLLAVIGLALLAARIAGERAAAAELGRVAAALPLASSALTGVVEKQRVVPVVLARDPEVRAALAEGAGRAELDAKLAAIATESGASVIYVIGRDGVAISASNAGRPDSFVGADYGFRAYFTRALREGAAAQYALGTVSGRPGLYLSHRVEGPAGPLGVVVVKVEFDELEARWRESGLVALVIDERGVVLATSAPERRFTATRELGDPAEARRALQLGAAPIPVVPIDWTGEGFARLDGRIHASAAGPVTEAGLRWRLMLFAPVAGGIAAAAWNAALTTLLAGLLLVAGAYALWRRRRRAAERARALAEMNAELERRVAARTEELRAEIAEREGAENRARRLREELAQANRLSILGQIAAGVAHEINQPLAAIRAYADTGARFAALGNAEEARGNFGAIAKVTERIGAITAQLRGFARRGAAEERRVGVEEAIEGALALLSGRIREAGVEIRRGPLSGAAVRAGRIRLEQILVNLLGNALDALRGREAPQIRIAVAEGPETVSISIRDNGPGIGAAARETLFLPFNTTKETGLGLGLVISGDLAREFGGELRLDPEDGTLGASFTLELRRVE